MSASDHADDKHGHAAHDSHHHDSHGGHDDHDDHDDHDHHEEELPPEPETPLWFTISGIALFVIMGVVFLTMIGADSPPTPTAKANAESGAPQQQAAPPKPAVQPGMPPGHPQQMPRPNASGPQLRPPAPAGH